VFEWLKIIFKKKEVPDYRTVSQEVKFNKSGVPEKFKDREFKEAFNGCCDYLPGYGCKE